MWVDRRTQVRERSRTHARFPPRHFPPRPQLAGLTDQAERFNKWQGLFGTPPYEFKSAPHASGALGLATKVWRTLADFDAKHKAWMEGAWGVGW